MVRRVARQAYAAVTTERHLQRTAVASTSLQSAAAVPSTYPSVPSAPHPSAHTRFGHGAPRHHREYHHHGCRDNRSDRRQGEPLDRAGYTTGHLCDLLRG